MFPYSLPTKTTMFPYSLPESLDLSCPRRSDSVETHKSPSPPMSSQSSEQGSNNPESFLIFRSKKTTMFPLRNPNPLPEALDLSCPRRSDSVETHKSPSPPMSSQSSEQGSNNPESSRSSPNEYKPTTHTNNHFGVPIANMSTYPGFLPLYMPPGMFFDQQTQNQFFAHTVAHQMLQIGTPKRNSETPESESITTTTNQNVRAVATSTSTPNSRKRVRPFTNYPKDPAGLPAYFNDENFMKFREVKMAKIHALNGGQPTVTNPKMRRTVPSNKVSEQGSSEGDADGSSNPKKDEAYYERRMKNNAAAKKSRDKRKINEGELAIRNEFLENEVAMLRAEDAMLRDENAMLRAEDAMLRDENAMLRAKIMRSEDNSKIE